MPAGYLIFGLLLLAMISAQAKSAIIVQGCQVELRISEISKRTVGIELLPLDERGNAQTSERPPTLAEFSAKEKFRARQLPDEKKVRVGQLRVTLKPQPLAVTVRRADGTLVQELIFNERTGSNVISFRTEAPVLGLGEGGDQFDRRGHDFPQINGQRYKLAELGARCFSPFLIGTDGWAMLVGAPQGSFDLRGGQGTFTPQQQAKRGAVSVFLTDAQQPVDAMREFVRLAGAPVMPPKWALGYMQSRRTLSTEADLIAEAKRFRESKLPCDAFILLGTGFCPAGWNFGHDSFQFNTNVFTRDAASVIRDLHTNHLRVVLHVVPLQRDYPSLHGQIPPGLHEKLDQHHIANYWKRHTDLAAAGTDGWWPDDGDWLDEASRLERHRMLWLHYPRDAEAVKLGDEFLWGRDLLIAPVTEKAATSRKVYLPEGEWFDWWTSERKSGKQWLERPVNLATMPIYVRAGAIIPFDPVRQYTAQPVSGPTEIKVFPGANGEFTLYDDDGESLGYRNGADPKAVWIRFQWDDGTRKLTIETDPRLKKWRGEARKFSVHVLGSNFAPVPVEFRGKRIVLKR